MIELSSIKKRREILSVPELLRIEPNSKKLPSTIVGIILLILSILYGFTIIKTLVSISDTPMQDTVGYIFPVTFITLGFLCVAAIILLLNSIKPLIFTSVGISGIYLMAIKYEQLDGYDWESIKGFDSSKQTLALLPKGVFSVMSYRDRLGNSIFGTYGYFFSNSQLKAAEEILEKAGVVKVNIK